MATKRARAGFSPKLISLAVASCFAAGTALANPTGPSVVNGQVSVQQMGNLLQITNSPNSIVNWQSFSIGVNEITRIQQQSAASWLLNRVTGAGGPIDPSVILGALQSNGRVMLINPSGIVFGAGAQIDVAGLVASSLNLSNADFLAGKLKFTDVPGAGSVVNQGNIATGPGGQVYLVGPSVTNSGIITSPQGEVVLAAGNSVELVNPGTPNLRVEITAADNEARNLGTIVADAGRVGIYAGLINHSGTTRADSAQVTDDGRIVLKATRNVTLEPTSVLSARGGGEIRVLADDTVRVAGRLDASAPNGGDGGFIETSGKNRVTIAPGTVVTTSAPFGRTGTWLIDPSDFTVAFSGGDMTGATLASLLGDTNVVITSDQGVTAGNGDIFVNDSVSWANSNSLTLTARRNVEVNSSITNSGTGDINLYAGWDGTSSASSPTLTPGVGDIVLSFSSVDTGGNVTFGAGRDISLESGRAWAGMGSPAGAHMVSFTAGRDIVLTDPDGTPQIQASGGAGAGATVDLTAARDVLITGGEVAAYAGFGSGINGGNARVSINSGRDVIVDPSTIEAFGGDSSGGIGGSALVQLVASGNIDLNNNPGNLCCGSGVRAVGGSPGGSGSVTLSAGGNINVQNSFIGGEGVQGGIARVTMAANGDIMIGNNSAIVANANDCCNIAPGDGGAAEVTLIAGNSLHVNGFSQIHADGGEGNVNGGAASVNLFAAGPASIVIDGAEGIGAFGGRGFSKGGDAAVTIASAGTVSVIDTSSSIETYNCCESGQGITARGGSSFSQDVGGNASVVLAGATGVSILRSHVEAVGGFGNASGGSAVVALLTTSGNITVDGTESLVSTVLAQGGGSNGTPGAAEVLIEANGPASSVNVVNDTIEAMGGEGGVGPGTINLFFLGRSTGGIFVNGVEGAIIGAPPLDDHGFFVNGDPAQPGVNFFVTYAPPDDTFNSEIISSMDNLLDTLIPTKEEDEPGSEDDKKKKGLPFCS